MALTSLDMYIQLLIGIKVQLEEKEKKEKSLGLNLF